MAFHKEEIPELSPKESLALRIPSRPRPPRWMVDFWGFTDVWRVRGLEFWVNVAQDGTPYLYLWWNGLFQLD